MGTCAGAERQVWRALSIHACGMGESSRARGRMRARARAYVLACTNLHAQGTVLKILAISSLPAHMPQVFCDREYCSER
jgi:hypothetical protein